MTSKGSPTSHPRESIILLILSSGTRDGTSARTRTITSWRAPLQRAADAGVTSGRRHRPGVLEKQEWPNLKKRLEGDSFAKIIVAKDLAIPPCDDNGVLILNVCDFLLEDDWMR